jgi:putative heme-binding domain-containing protein
LRSSPTTWRLLTALNSHYPTGDYHVDRELAALLVRLDAPDLVPRLLRVLDGAATMEEGIDAAMSLSACDGPWTIDQRKHLLDWFDRISNSRGGRSYFGYIVGARTRFIAARGRSGQQLPNGWPNVGRTQACRRRIRRCPRVELDGWPPSSCAMTMQNGRRMFSAATCYNCHRIAGEGSSVGPDLTAVGRRFGVRDILQAIIEPNHEVSDQYRQMVFETNGRTIVGRVSNLTADTVIVSTDMLDPGKEVTIRRDEIDDQHPSETSLMPAGLLNSLNEDELLDLIAFLRAGGADGAAPDASSASSSIRPAGPRPPAR